jgi:hypothetical protein
MNYLCTCLKALLVSFVSLSASTWHQKRRHGSCAASIPQEKNNPGLNQLHKSLGCFHYLKEAQFHSSAEAQLL